MPARTVPALTLSLCLVAAGLCAAESPTAREQKTGLHLGGGLLFGAPQGDFGKQVGHGGGVFGHAVYALAGGALGLRADASYFLYGSETVRVPVSRQLDRISTEVTTDNWVGQLAVGPELMLPSGPIRPYVNAFVGLAYFSTSSEARDPFRFAPMAYSTNFDDTAFSYGGGAGIRVPLGRSSASLDAGARYARNGRVSYLAKGDIRDDGSGGIAFTPRRSRGDLLEFRLGVTFAP